MVTWTAFAILAMFFLNNDMHSKMSIFRCWHVSHNMLGHYVPCRVVLPVGRIMAQKTLVMPIAKLSQLTQHLRPYSWKQRGCCELLMISVMSMFVVSQGVQTRTVVPAKGTSKTPCWNMLCLDMSKHILLASGHVTTGQTSPSTHILLSLIHGSYLCI